MKHKIFGIIALIGILLMIIGIMLTYIPILPNIVPLVIAAAGWIGAFGSACVLLLFNADYSDES